MELIWKCWVHFTPLSEPACCLLGACRGLIGGFALMGCPNNRCRWVPETYIERVPRQAQAQASLPLPPRPEPTQPPAQPPAEVVEAMYDLAATNQGDLSFSAGDQFTVLRREDADWMFVCRRDDPSQVGPYVVLSLPHSSITLCVASWYPGKGGRTRPAGPPHPPYRHTHNRSCTLAGAHPILPTSSISRTNRYESGASPMFNTHINFPPVHTGGPCAAELRRAGRRGGAG